MKNENVNTQKTAIQDAIAEFVCCTKRTILKDRLRILPRLFCLSSISVFAASLVPVAGAQSDAPRRVERDSAGRAVSPNDVPRRIEEAVPNRLSGPTRKQPGPNSRPPQESSGDPFLRLHEFRQIDGYGNNVDNPEWGEAGTPLFRFAAPAYADDASEPSGSTRPNARLISSIVAAQGEDSIPSGDSISDFVWQWGQFLDHDIDLTPTADPIEAFDIEVPVGDAYFDPDSSGSETIPLNRSQYLLLDGVREQINIITSYIDASNVYGSDDAHAMELRALDGTGRLKTSSGDLLPLSLDGDPNVPADTPFQFYAGDERANEQVGLTAMHTLFMREHNYWADRIRGNNAVLDGETIYQRARAMVAAEIQCITYKEFLPVLLGKDALASYRGYRPDVDVTIGNEFATAAYRVGHTMLSSQLLRLDSRLKSIEAGPLALRNAFFNPSEVLSVGIEPYLRGLTIQTAQEIDCFIIDDVRNFLFGQPGDGGFDLASLNLQRGRDHGLPDYNQVRAVYGLAPVTSFAEISSDSIVQQRLAEAYGSVDDMDLWIAGLSEDHVQGAVVGETFWMILREQFMALRNGDRYWYQHYLPRELRSEVESRTLSTIIRRNTNVGNEIPDNVFKVRDVRRSTDGRGDGRKR